MTIDELRKHYPFIAYGNQYFFWKKLGEWYNWLWDRIWNERPCSYTCHDWRGLVCSYFSALKDREDAFKRLPKPTKAQIKDDNDPEYPWKPGKWPEKSMPKVREFCKAEEQCKKVANNVAAMLTLNDYHINVLGEKKYQSSKEKEEEYKKNRGEKK